MILDICSSCVRFLCCSIFPLPEHLQDIICMKRSGLRHSHCGMPIFACMNLFKAFPVLTCSIASSIVILVICSSSGLMMSFRMLSSFSLFTASKVVDIEVGCSQCSL